MAKFTAIYHSCWADSRSISAKWFERYGNVVTDIIHFKVDPILSPPYFKFDGGEDNFTKNQSQIIADAHAKGIKVHLCIGGVGSSPIEGWARVTEKGELFTRIVVQRLGEYCRKHGYDGFDLDWESEVTESGFKLLAPILRHEVDSFGGVLSAAVGRFPNHPVDVLNIYFDQIYIMGYDCNGWWSDGISGFHEPLHDVSGKYLIKDPEKVFNFDEMDRRWTAAGLDKSKSAFGIAFYGRCWSGANAPGMRASSPNSEGIDHYYNIMNRVKAGELVEHYEPLAGQVWAGNPNGMGYANFNSPLTVQEKISWMKEKGYQGVMLFANEHAIEDGNTCISPLLDAVAGNVQQQELTSPEFTEKPKSTTVEVGQSATFTARAIGNPAPELKWWRIDEYGIQFELGTGNSITLQGSEIGNDQIYVSAANTQGSVTEQATLSVVSPRTSPIEARLEKLEAFEQEARDFYAKIKKVFG